MKINCQKQNLSDANIVLNRPVYVNDVMTPLVTLYVTLFFFLSYLFVVSRRFTWIARN